jgi:tetratricopeptide (TPR) repeat protein
LNKAVELGPNRVDAYNTRGAILREMKRYDEAIADFTKAIELDPGNAEAYCRMGITFLFIERYDDAITNMEKGLKLNPSLEPNVSDYLKEAKEKKKNIK